MALAQLRVRAVLLDLDGTLLDTVLDLHAAADGMLAAGGGSSQLFIYPGYGFRFVDAMLTNFHLPRSSLLMLVSALAGKGNIDRAYAAAIEQKYRFFSFGDAMFIH